MHCAMEVRESANWRNVSSQLDLRIELSIESTASSRDGGKAEAIAFRKLFLSAAARRVF
jgi:hypothetical protein